MSRPLRGLARRPKCGVRGFVATSAPPETPEALPKRQRENCYVCQDGLCMIMCYLHKCYDISLSFSLYKPSGCGWSAFEPLLGVHAGRHEVLSERLLAGRRVG